MSLAIIYELNVYNLIDYTLHIIVNILSTFSMKNTLRASKYQCLSSNQMHAILQALI